jgi:hypothetical protein
MKRVGWIAQIAAAASLLAACALQNVPENATAPRPGRGIAVISLTRTGTVDSELWLMLRPAGGSFRNQVLLDGWRDTRDWSETAFVQQGVNRLELADPARPIGRLAVMELPPGEYEFYGWTGDTRIWPRVTMHYTLAAAGFSVRFTVREGAVTYLGALRLELPPVLQPLQFRGDYRLQTLQDPERDLAVLRNKFPALAAAVVSAGFASASNPIQGEFLMYPIQEKDSP